MASRSTPPTRPKGSATGSKHSPRNPDRPRLRPTASQPQTTSPSSSQGKLDNGTIRPTPQRLLYVWAVMVFGSLALVAKLYQLQIVDGATLRQKAQAQQSVLMNPALPRRPIVDRLGHVLAIDQPAYILYAHPKLFKVPRSEMIGQLAPLLQLYPVELEKLFSQAETGIKVSDSVSEDVAKQIRELRLDGLELTPRQQRLYPQNDLFAEVVGYVNMDRQGQTGVELSQQNLLDRATQRIRVTHRGDDAILPAPLAGLFQTDDLRLQLTVDSRVQRAARAALKQQLQQYGAKRGVVIVMDARDGGLRALVSEPSFNPNQYYKSDLSLLKNWAITDLFEPGSTFKPINVAIALETNTIKPNSVFYDEGQITVDGWPIRNNDYASAGARGSQTITQILMYSSNVGMVHMMAQLKRKEFYRWLQKLGLGRPTDIDLPSETAGQLKTEEQFVSAAIEPATAAFGQGLSLTPLQLAQLHAILANGGNLVVPHVVEGLVDANGQMQWQPDRPPPHRIFSQKTSQTVVQMMTAVVNDGTGKPSQIPRYQVAGKTGTAQKATAEGGYGNARITSFVGILPANAPRYVVLAVVDEPKGDNAFGSTVSAPIVKAVMEVLISLDGIPPSPSNPSR